jgi:hypothetical protein
MNIFAFINTERLTNMTSTGSNLVIIIQTFVKQLFQRLLMSKVQT